MKITPQVGHAFWRRKCSSGKGPVFQTWFMSQYGVGRATVTNTASAARRREGRTATKRTSAGYNIT